MTLLKSLRRVAPALLAVAVVVDAQAASYVTLSGANVDFLIDTDYFDVSAAVVTGNAITFNFEPDRYVSSAAGVRPRDYVSDAHTSTGAKALLVVAHQGYDLGSSFTTSSNTQFVRSLASGGTGSAFVGADAYIGNYAGGVFSGDSTRDSTAYVYSNWYQYYDSISTQFAQTTVRTDALALDVLVNSSANASGPNSVTVTTYSVGYQFTAVADGAALPPPGTTLPPVISVPEPETYAMLLAGLALIGVARRRKG
jgi:hypothetical protein